METFARYRLKNYELIIMALALAVPLIVVVLYWPDCWIVAYIYPIFPILVSARCGQRRQQIKEQLLKSKINIPNVAIDFGRRFPLTTVTQTGIFPKINCIYADSQDIPFVAQKGNISFSHLACAIGSAVNGVSGYTHLGEFIFFRLSAETASVCRTLVVLPDRWKMQFGKMKALRFMGHWQDAPPRVMVDGFEKLWVYCIDCPPTDALDFGRVSSVLNCCQPILNDCLTQGICMALTADAVFVVMPVKIKISVFSSSKNKAQMDQYLLQINAVLEKLQQTEHNLHQSPGQYNFF